MNRLTVRVITAAATAAAVFAILSLLLDLDSAVQLAVAVLGSMAAGSAAAILVVNMSHSPGPPRQRPPDGR